jgi:hypothetical protein
MEQASREDPDVTPEGERSGARTPTGVVTAALIVALLAVGGPLVAAIGTPLALVVYVGLSGVYAWRSRRWTALPFGLLWGMWAAFFLPAGSLGWPLIAAASVILMAAVVVVAKNTPRTAADR